MNEISMNVHYKEWKDKVDADIAKQREDKQKLRDEYVIIQWDNKIYMDHKLREYFAEIIDNNNKRLIDIEESIKRIENEIAIKTRLSTVLEFNIE